MVEETISSIRATEQQAQELIAKATQESETILADAKQKAQQLIAQAKTDSAAKAKAELERERAAGEEQRKKALEETDADIAAMRTQANAREQEVISAVIAALV